MEHRNIVNYSWQLVKGIAKAIGRATKSGLESLSMNLGAMLEALWGKNGA